MNKPIFHHCNPKPSDVRYLEPVNISEGIMFATNTNTGKSISDDTKLYIIKYIGTLEEVQFNSADYGFANITGNDKIEYGNICLYINTNFNNPTPSKLEPVNISEGIVSIDDPKTGKPISDDTKIYIVKYIGTLQEIQNHSEGINITGNDNIVYGTIDDVRLYENTKFTHRKRTPPPAPGRRRSNVEIVPVDELYKSTQYNTGDEWAYRIDNNQDNIFGRIKYLIDTGYYNNKSFLETANLYSKYYPRFFIDKKIKLFPEIHQHRIRIFAILGEVLYPYYVSKYGEVLKETFIMAIFYHYFSVRHSNDVDASNDIYTDKSKQKDLLNILLFLASEMEPALSNVVMKVSGGKPKTKKNKLRKTRKILRRRRTRRT
jgi:hypothetical protein